MAVHDRFKYIINHLQRMEFVFLDAAESMHRHKEDLIHSYYNNSEWFDKCLDGIEDGLTDLENTASGVEDGVGFLKDIIREIWNESYPKHPRRKKSVK